MSRRPSTFRQSDLTRALKGLKAAGEQVARVEIDSAGRIVIITGRDGPDVRQANELDAWMAKRARATQRLEQHH